jgi:serine/threonine-protein kinase
MAEEASQAGLTLHEGDVLGGKYLISKILGVGGMGVVVAARHVQLDEAVAIKLLRSEFVENAEVVARFAREARAAVRIKSEHVARVMDVGVLETGAPYMVMEHLDGHDLSAWLHERGPLPLEQAVDFVLQACEAVASAHALGIVHRDLKPANLFCVRGMDRLWSIKVLDFGISKLTNPAGSNPELTMTRANAVFGSPLYMAPEQMLSSRSADTRTDLWALGVILYELLTGRVPFGGDTLPEVYARIMTQPPAPLRNRRPDAPAEVEAVLLKCLEKEPVHRYQDVAELALALMPWAPKRAHVLVERITRVLGAAGLSTVTFSLRPSTGPAGTSSAAKTQASWGQTASALGQKSRAGALLVLGVLGLMAGGGTALWLRTGAASGESSQAAGLAKGSVAANPSSPQSTASARVESFVSIDSLPLSDSVGRDPSKARGQVPGKPGVDIAPGKGLEAKAPVFAAAPLPSRQLPPAWPPASSAAPPVSAPPVVTQPLAGFISMNSIPVSRVLVDGKPMGFTPARWTGPVGAHSVTFIHAERGRQTVAVEVKPGGTSLATVRFP